MDIALILQEKYSGTVWSLDGNTYEGLDWLDESPKPKKKYLEKVWPEVQKNFLIKEVESARAESYQKISDPIFFKYQRGEATKKEWLDAIQLVKDSYPYPEKVE
jgi:hypothetical protein